MERKTKNVLQDHMRVCIITQGSENSLNRAQQAQTINKVINSLTGLGLEPFSLSVDA